MMPESLPFNLRKKRFGITGYAPRTPAVGTLTNHLEYISLGFIEDTVLCCKDSGIFRQTLRSTLPLLRRNQQHNCFVFFTHVYTFLESYSFRKEQGRREKQMRTPHRKERIIFFYCLKKKGLASARLANKRENMKIPPWKYCSIGGSHSYFRLENYLPEMGMSSSNCRLGVLFFLISAILSAEA